MSLWTACPKILHIARYLISIVIQVHYDHLPGNKHTLYIMIIYQETSIHYTLWSFTRKHYTLWSFTRKQAYIIHYDHLPGNKHTLYIMIIYQETSIHYDLEISYQEFNKIHEQLNYNDPYNKNKTKFTPSMLPNKLHHRCNLIVLSIYIELVSV